MYFGSGKIKEEEGTDNLTHCAQLHINYCHEAPLPSQQRKRIPVINIWNFGKRRKVRFDTGHNHMVTYSLTSSLLHRLGKEGRSFLIHTISLMSS